MRRQYAFQFKLIDAIFQRNELVKQRHVYSVPVSQQSATGPMQTEPYFQQDRSQK